MKKEIINNLLGNKLSLKTTPTRIICLVPSLTELLFDLGLDKFIVGVTKFCVHPSDARKTKTIVGGTKHIKINKIKELSPDIILCNKEENTREIVEICNKIAPTHVSDISSLEDTYNLIIQYGILFNCMKKAEDLVDQIQCKATQFLKEIENRPVKEVAYFIWKNPWMAAGRNTFINHLLELNHFKNVFSDIERYPEVAIKDLKEKKDLELILLSSEPYPFKEEHVYEINTHVKSAQVIFVNGEYFSWYGSRLLKAFDYFTELHKRLQ